MASRACRAWPSQRRLGLGAQVREALDCAGAEPRRKRRKGKEREKRKKERKQKDFVGKFNLQNLNFGFDEKF